MVVDIPNRDPRLPQFYLLETHKKVQATWKAKRIFLYLQDTSAKAMEDYYKYVSTMTFPEGTAQGVAAVGTLLSPVSLTSSSHRHGRLFGA